MTRTHDLKTVQPYFDDIAAGRKTFEMRLNDRQYQPGDTVILREFNPGGACLNLHENVQANDTWRDKPGPNCQYTGRTLRFRIGYVLSAAPGVPLGDHVVFSLIPISARATTGTESFAMTAPQGPETAIINHVVGPTAGLISDAMAIERARASRETRA